MVVVVVVVVVAVRVTTHRASDRIEAAGACSAGAVARSGRCGRLPVADDRSAGSAPVGDEDMQRSRDARPREDRGEQHREGRDAGDGVMSTDEC